MGDFGYVAMEYAEGHREMLLLHDGAALIPAAHAILEDLPEGPLTFVATSIEGTALAAVCAALRADGSDWQRVLLVGPHTLVQHQPIFVEPVDGGSGWRNAVLRRYPQGYFALAGTPAPLAIA
jgi:hypothetical protein